MSDRTLAQKMGIKPGWRTHVVGAPDGVLDTLGLPPLEMTAELTGEFDTCTCSCARRSRCARTSPTWCRIWP